MRICFVSDTHEMHGRLTQAVIAARANVLVHSGDFTGRGHLDKLASFADWCAMLVRKQYVRHVVAVAGNHDLTLDARQPNAGSSPEVARALLVDAGVRYLEDDGAEIDGVRFWGSPWTPRFCDWGFQIDDAEHDRRIWERVPLCDVLVTHGPPFGIRDLAPGERRVGSPGLRDAVERVRPRIHAFGHIHGQYGCTAGAHTLFVNAATCTDAYRPSNAPIVIDLEGA